MRTLLITLLAFAFWPTAASATAICQAGVADNFSTGNGTELSSPAAVWLGCLGTTSGVGLQGQLDDCHIDRYVGHSFDLTSCPSDGDTTGSGTILVIVRVKGVAATSSNPANDYLLLGIDGVARWGKSLNHLQCLRTGGADCTWSGGDSATFVLDLQNLPSADPPPAGWCSWPTSLTNLVPLVGGAGNLDVGVTDDSCVDFIAIRYDTATPVRRDSWGTVKVRYR